MAFTTFRLVLIAQLFQIVIVSSYEIYTMLLIFFSLAFLGSLLSYFKKWDTFGIQMQVRNIFLPLVPIAIIIIRRLTSIVF
jgi:hypothetical protein